MSSPQRTSRDATLKIGYVVKMFPRLSETFILNEILELEQQGLGLHIFSLKKPADEVVHTQAALVRSPVSYLPERVSESLWRIARAQLYVWRRYPGRWRHVRRNEFRRKRSGAGDDNKIAFWQACCVVAELGVIRHLHAHYANVPAKIALLVHRLTGITYSITTHAKDIFQDDPFGSTKLQERMCRASFVVANSEFSAEHIRAGLKDRGDVRVVRNGLDLRSFPLRTTEPSQPVILAVGRLVEKKGFPDLISACQILRRKGVRFRCEIVGTGVLSSKLKEQIRLSGVGDLVRLVGPLPQHLLAQHYNQAMVFVLPCVAAADGNRDVLPNAIKEAMAVGVPVVTTRLEAIEELVQDNMSGLLVPPGDPVSLAEKIELLLRDAELRRRLAGTARRVVEERFDRRTTFGLLKQFLEEAAGKSVGQSSQAPEPGSLLHEESCLH